jgi:threonylcarbamoyladenosine tRNA methylthiotransferase MtaB
MISFIELLQNNTNELVNGIKNILNQLILLLPPYFMVPYKTAAYYTLGCKLNFSETSSIARNLADAGYARVDFDEAADVYVINTCSVTDMADKKCRNIVRKAKRQNPAAHVVVIGCYAQLKPQEIASIPGVNLVLGAQEKFNVAHHLDTLDGSVSGRYVAGKIGKVREFHPSYSAGDRTRTFLKIQDGCDYFCTFCTIPLARGKSRSNTIAETLKVAHEIESSDINEVVLTGVNTGDFGSGTQENFFDLIQKLDKLSIPRFRISSIEPNLLSKDIIDFVAKSQHFAPHFHIPLQSGSNRILQAMKRKYDTQLYADRIARIKEKMPHCAIGVDVIVGFPGEDDAAFEETFNFIQDLDVSYLHVFTYSERPNTLAIKMEDVVPQEVRNERNLRLRILSEKKKRAFYESQLKRSATVLWESERDGDMMFGFTENYIKVKCKYDETKVNSFEFIVLDELDRDGIFKVAVLETVMN